MLTITTNVYASCLLRLALCAAMLNKLIRALKSVQAPSRYVVACSGVFLAAPSILAVVLMAISYVLSLFFLAIYMSRRALP